MVNLARDAGGDAEQLVAEMNDANECLPLAVSALDEVVRRAGYGTREWR